MMRETSDLIEKCGDGSSPSEAHCGGWEGLGKDGGEIEMFPFLHNILIFKVSVI
ncbi:MAG: hypothetical protein U9O50_04110 [Acidobacteriota bacterium]|nr:hypothetical protein [Acidobacteriota bacterium]